MRGMSRDCPSNQVCTKGQRPATPTSGRWVRAGRWPATVTFDGTASLLDRRRRHVGRIRRRPGLGADVGERAALPRRRRPRGRAARRRWVPPAARPGRTHRPGPRSSRGGRRGTGRVHRGGRPARRRHRAGGRTRGRRPDRRREPGARPSPPPARIDERSGPEPRPAACRPRVERRRAWAVDTPGPTDTGRDVGSWLSR